jgi:hypothetical protein
MSGSKALLVHLDAKPGNEYELARSLEARREPALPRPAS